MRLPTERVLKTETCWLWQGHEHTSLGYGRVTVDGVRWLAHRLAYTEEFGEIPEGLQIDHLCRNPRCVRPSHLEAVTAKVNTLRSENPTAKNARKTRCRHGHPLSGDNLYVRPSGRRNCRTCKREQLRDYRAREGVSVG